MGLEGLLCVLTCSLYCVPSKANQSFTEMRPEVKPTFPTEEVVSFTSPCGRPCRAGEYVGGSESSAWCPVDSRGSKGTICV